MLSNIHWARPKILFEVAVPGERVVFFFFYILSFFLFLLLLHSLLPFILFHLFPAALSLLSWFTLPHLWNRYIVELYLSASLPIFSTKSTLVNSLCLLLCSFIITRHPTGEQHAHRWLARCCYHTYLCIKASSDWVCIVLLTIKKQLVWNNITKGLFALPCSKVVDCTVWRLRRNFCSCIHSAQRINHLRI